MAPSKTTANDTKNDRDIMLNGDSSIPKWLNEAFFADVLKKQFGRYDLESFKVEATLGKGENYSSALHKVEIEVQLPDGKRNTANYLTKSMLNSGASQEFAGNLSFFPKEIEMYEKVIPQMEILYKQFGVEVAMGAQCVKVQKQPPVIVMEDLRAKNYSNVNRLDGVDLEHSKAVLEKLAKWHAATARIHQLRGEYSEHLTQGILTPAMEEIFKVINVLMWPALKESILEWGDSSKYLDKMDRFQKSFMDQLRECDKVNPLEFNVLNHGDAWCNNMMFKHNADGTVADVKFVDLQLCKWGSPAQDLQYFIFSSCNPHIKTKKFDYMIRHYHKHLVENLKLIKYSAHIPTLVDLHIELLKKGFFDPDRNYRLHMSYRMFSAFHTSLSVLTVVLLDPSEESNMDNFIRPDEVGQAFRKKMYSNPRYVKVIQQILPFLENRGILDA